MSVTPSEIERSGASSPEGENSSTECVDVDDDLQDKDTMALIIEKLTPYMTNFDKDVIEQKLRALGVETLGDLAHLEHKDVETFIKPIQFRKFVSSLKGESVAPAQKVRNAASYSVPEHLFSRDMKAHLEGPTRIIKMKALKLVRLIADDIFDHYGHAFNANIVKRAVALLCSKYPGALGGKFCKEASQDFFNRVKNRVQYLQGRELGKRHKCKNIASTKSLIGTSAFGIPSGTDLPNELPTGETPQSQSEKKAQLQRMAALAEINWAKAEILMRQTYASQRSDINNHLSVDELLELWPLIGKHTILTEHFYFLMSIDKNQVTERMATLFPKLMAFMKAETEAQRRKAGSTTEEKLRDVILKCDETGSAKCLVMGAVLCIMLYLKLDEKSIFIYFKETTSFDEVQASKSLPDDGKPVIAVLGSDVLHDVPCCFVVVDKRILFHEKLTPFQAFMSLFMSYFVFKILYPPKVAALMDFIQRQMFDICTTDASKERTKTDRTVNKKGRSVGAPPISGKYLGFMRKFEEFAGAWTRVKPTSQ